MLLYPKLYYNSVKDISVLILKQNHIKGLILDVDNTLIDYYKKFPEGVKEWVQEMKDNHVKLYILSNSNKKEKVEMVSKELKLPYEYFAKKPFKKGFLKIQRIWEIEPEQIGVVGDQIFTDVLGANRCHMFPILVKPIAEKDIWVTIFKRPIENYFINGYLKAVQKANEKRGDE